MNENKYKEEKVTIYIPDKEWFTPKEISKILGRSQQFIRDLIEDKVILGHILGSKNGRSYYQVSRQQLLLYIISTANFSDNDFSQYVKDFLKKSSTSQLKIIQKQLNQYLISV